MVTLTHLREAIERLQDLHSNDASPPNTSREALMRDRLISIRLSTLDDISRKLHPYVIKRRHAVAQKTNAKKGDWGNKFYQVRLSDQHMKEFKQWREKNTDDVELFWVEMLQDNYKVSASYSDNTEYFYVTAIGGEAHHVNKSSSMTSFAPDIITALLLTYYKVAILFAWGKWVESEQEREEFG